MYKKIIIKYAELSTKGKNKSDFIKQLERNMINICDLRPIVFHDMMIIDFSKSNLEKLEYVFGISYYSPTIEVNTSLEEIKNAAIELSKKWNKFDKFRIKTKRNWKEFKYTSNEIDKIIGSEILSKNENLTVDLKKFDHKLNIYIRKDKTYIFADKIIGLGGYPTGISGNVILLISGGIDSPVAAWELMKRGLHVDFLSFITPPHTDDETTQKILKIIKILNNYQGTAKLYTSNYTSILNLLGLTSMQSYKIILMRRSFYRISTLLAKKYNYKAIANGDNIAQVASQTLESLNVIQSATNVPIFRPLLTANKIDTINKSKKIGTYDTSIIRAKETCELFAPKKPITKPRLEKVELLEKELPNLSEYEYENFKNIELKII